FVGLLFRTSLGSRRSHVWPHHAIPGTLTWNGGRARALCGFWHPDAANLSRCVHEPSRRNYFRPDHSPRHCCLPRRNYSSRTGRHLERARDVAGTTKGGNQRIRSKERNRRRRSLRRHERMLRLWIGRRRSYQNSNPSTRHCNFMAGTACAGGCAHRRVPLEIHLVPQPTELEQNRRAILQLTFSRAKAKSSVV